jgi:hypothetical protein
MERDSGKKNTFLQSWRTHTPRTSIGQSILDFDHAVPENTCELSSKFWALHLCPTFSLFCQRTRVSDHRYQ